MLVFEEGVMGRTAEEEMKGSMGAGSVQRSKQNYEALMSRRTDNLRELKV